MGRLRAGGPDWPFGIIDADEYQTIVADLHERRDNDAPLDVIAISDVTGTKPAADDLDRFADAGVTWMLVQAFGVDGARERAAQGPPRV